MRYQLIKTTPGEDWHIRSDSLEDIVVALEQRLCEDCQTVKDSISNGRGWDDYTPLEKLEEIIWTDCSIDYFIEDEHNELQLF